MKRTPLLILLLLAFATGCASPYWKDRGADMADVFTATVGVGLGATARIGPLHAGLGANFDLYGIEAGKVGELGRTGALVWDAGGHFAGDYSLLAWGKSHIDLDGDSRFRGKNLYPDRGPPGWIPFWNPPSDRNPNPARWTQIEVAAGLLGGVRLGFNPGELLDFVLGFFGIDIYNDDLAHKENKPKSHAETAVTATPTPHAESAEGAKEPAP